MDQEVLSFPWEKLLTDSRINILKPCLLGLYCDHNIQGDVLVVLSNHKGKCPMLLYLDSSSPSKIMALLVLVQHRGVEAHIRPPVYVGLRALCSDGHTVAFLQRVGGGLYQRGNSAQGSILPRGGQQLCPGCRPAQKSGSPVGNSPKPSLVVTG